MIEEAGCRWPLDPALQHVGPGTYRGDTGLLTVTVHDGRLIDPERCASAEAAKPAGWKLVRTCNGTAMTGTYSEQQAQVLVYLVRADEADQGGAAYPLPEVQATYVVTRGGEVMFERIRAALEVRPIAAEEYGPLDGYGHAEMGPIPVVSSWMPVGDFVDNTGTLGTTALGGGHLTYVGGGWLMFADETKCCSLSLEPKPWRALDQARAINELTLQLEPRGERATIVSDTTAQVWGFELGPGFGYEVRDPVGDLRGVGAFWTDPFSQPWHLRYWFTPEHRAAVVEAVRDCSAATRPK